jgi:DNA-binding CsgD family transcriptional regulator
MDLMIMKIVNKKVPLSETIKIFGELNQFSHDVHWIGSPDFNTFFYVSPAYEKIWCRSLKDLCENPELWITYFLPEDAKHYHPLKEMAKRVGPDARYDELYRIVLPTKEVRWILDKGHPIFNERGDCLAVTGVASDITIYKELESFKNDAYYIWCIQHGLPEVISELSRTKKLSLKIPMGKKSNDVTLTMREIQCILEIFKGKTAKEIAKSFNLSPRTVEHLLERIKFKLKCKTRYQLIETISNNLFNKS